MNNVCRLWLISILITYLDNDKYYGEEKHRKSLSL
jgi:hypothetical protein